jgi:hypothetical protein
VRANHIGGAMVSVLALSAVDPSIKPCTKDYQIGIFCFKQLQGGRAKLRWLRIRVMCLSGATCLSTDCCFSELEL